MKCPVDSIDLIMSERSGVEIDYCPQCRGVWLDRGELDKIIDRASEATGAAVPAGPAPGAPPLYPNYQPRRDESRRDEPRYDNREHGGPGYDRDHDRRRPKKKEGWLGELFDF